MKLALEDFEIARPIINVDKAWNVLNLMIGFAETGLQNRPKDTGMIVYNDIAILSMTRSKESQEYLITMMKQFLQLAQFCGTLAVENRLLSTQEWQATNSQPREQFLSYVKLCLESIGIAIQCIRTSRLDSPSSYDETAEEILLRRLRLRGILHTKSEVGELLTRTLPDFDWI